MKNQYVTAILPVFALRLFIKKYLFGTEFAVIILCMAAADRQGRSEKD